MYPASAFKIEIVKKPGKDIGTNEAPGAAFISKNDQSGFLAKGFFGSIEEKRTARLDVHTLLAHVMAHEVGHLLLGKEHTPATVMAANWTKEEYALMSGELLRFSESHANQLQIAVAMRMNSPNSFEPDKFSLRHINHWASAQTGSG